MSANTGTVLLHITSDANSVAYEKRFATTTSISDLKAKLELITGSNCNAMILQLLDFNDQSLIANLDDDSAQLASYVANIGTDKVHIHVKDDHLKNRPFDDTSTVEKFVLDDEKYAQRTNSMMAFKLQNKLGRFGDQSDKSNDKCDTNPDTVPTAANASDIKVGDRCEVSVRGMPKRRATVMFVGSAHFKPGVWVGVKYDEPLGKNDGSVDGNRYFHCAPNYGGFVRPNDLTIGQFPEIIDFEEEI